MFFFRRLKINHESHEFILDSGTVANTLFILVHSKQSHLFIESNGDNKGYITITKYVINITVLIIIKNCVNILNLKYKSLFFVEKGNTYF